MFKQTTIYLLIFFIMFTLTMCNDKDKSNNIEQIENKEVTEEQSITKTPQVNDEEIKNVEESETKEETSSALDIIKEEAEEMKASEEGNTGRKAKKSDVVSIHYVGKVKDGKEFASSYKDAQPLTFEVGADEVIDGLEEAIIGMKKYEEKVVTIPPEKGYGNWSEDYVITVPLTKFGDISPAYEVGDTISVETPQGDFAPVIVELTDKEIRLDFNHNLMGKTLVFEVELIDIR
jgi:peptidylprolyl isomerase